MNRIAFFILFVFSAFSISICKAQSINEPMLNPDWEKPYEPFRIVGNLYYIGTYDLASYLIVTEKGNIIINTGISGSLDDIKRNIKALGFKYADTKILLANHAHYDHVGALAAIQKETGAQFYASAADAEVYKDGGQSDYELSHLGMSFQPVQPNRLLKDKDTIELGDQQLTFLHHPGHTKGSASYMLDVKDEQQVYKVLIANIPTIIIDRKFSEVQAYPNIRKDYEYTFKKMKNIGFDIWVAAHASQFRLHEKRKPGDPYRSEIFNDKAGYNKALEKVEQVYLQKIKEEE